MQHYLLILLKKFLTSTFLTIATAVNTLVMTRLVVNTPNLALMHRLNIMMFNGKLIHMASAVSDTASNQADFLNLSKAVKLMSRALLSISQTFEFSLPGEFKLQLSSSGSLQLHLSIHIGCSSSCQLIVLALANLIAGDASEQSSDQNALFLFARLMPDYPTGSGA